MTRLRRLAQLLGIVLLIVVVLGVLRRLLGSGAEPALPAEPAPTSTRPTSAPPAAAAVDAPAGVETPVPWWVTPDDGSCPLSHPVKAKASSGIYHVPGGQSYERTTPDRCYLSPAAAEADGYRAAKR
jgi:hypothetical protein